MTRYVAGFALAPDSVLMVCKTRPAALAGKFNAVGGKIAQELPLAAMQREFYEETGAPDLDWKFFCKLSGDYPLHKPSPSVSTQNITVNGVDYGPYFQPNCLSKETKAEIRKEYSRFDEGELFTVYFYHARVPQEFPVPAVNDVGEALLWLSYAEAGDPLRVLPNVTWLLPMARSFAYGERATNFTIQEKYLDYKNTVPQFGR